MATQTQTVTETKAIQFPSVADPAPLGLAGFAMTTTLLSALNAGFIHSGGLIFVGMALFYGGLAQFCAGMWEFRRGNTFGATAFSSYGGFWMGLAILFVFDSFLKPANAYIGNDGLAWFLFMWGIFTAYMFIASLRTNAAVALVFFLLTLTYFALWGGVGLREAAGTDWTLIGGWLGLATAAAAYYASFATVTNLTWGKQVLPVLPLNLPMPKLG